ARIKAIEVARFHGMKRPEPYAMGAAPGKPPVHIPEVEATEIPAGEEATPEKVKAKAKPVEQKKEEPTLSQLMVEHRLKALFVLGFFWRHGSAKPGEKVKLHVVATGYDGKSFAIKVKDPVSGKTADPGVTLKIDNGAGVAEVAIPNAGWGFGSSAWIFAIAEG